MRHESVSQGNNQESAKDWLGDDVPEFANYGDKKANSAPANKEAPKNAYECLASPEHLTKIGENYLKQYERGANTSSGQLNQKRYLDELVYQRLTSGGAADFVKTNEFQNYAKFTMWMAQERRFNTLKGDLYPETITNPLLKDERTRDLIINSLYSKDSVDNVRAMVEKKQAVCRRALETVDWRIENGRKLTQNQIDFLGDYVYLGGNYDDGHAKKLAEYTFNCIDKTDTLKPSVPMLGALANYFAKNYTIDEDVRKQSRFYIGDCVYSPGDMKTGVSSQVVGCTLEKSEFLNMSLTSDESLKKSRTNRENDLYRFMMISFHEATHDHQRFSLGRGEDTPSAMAYATNLVLRRDLNCIPVEDKATGDTKKVGYYKANHDSDEIEIGADEEAWRQCRAFIVNHCKTYGEEHRNRAIVDEYWRRRELCLENEREVHARRAFTRKKNREGDLVTPMYYDVEELSSKISENPGILKEYPIFKKYYNNDGSLRMAFMYDSRVAATDREGLDERTDNMGVEFGAYLVNDNKQVEGFVKFIRENGKNLSNAQSKRLLDNMFNVLHQHRLQSGMLEKVNFDNYDETRSHMDQTPQEIHDSLLVGYLRQLYHCTRIAEEIRKTHPDMNKTITDEENTYFASYYTPLARLGTMPRERAASIVDRYERTKNPSLRFVAMQIRQQYGIPKAENN